jgi:hypothetical protein
MELLAELHWRPQIGDPTLMGWFTVWAYAAAGLLALLTARPRGGAPWNKAWLTVAVGLAFLCVNKQLDLQSLLTDLGRELFRSLGLYEARRTFQKLFVFAALGLAAAGAGWVTWHYRAFCGRNRLLVAGLFFLLTFIVVRAISFHHVDKFLGTRVAGMKLNWMLELTGIGLVAAAAGAELRARPAPAIPPRPFGA